MVATRHGKLAVNMLWVMSMNEVAERVDEARLMCYYLAVNVCDL